MIVTAASQAFAPSLLALLGSLDVNWPAHPPIRVYDLGLDSHTVKIVREAGCEVVGVPAFCPHWRRHFTWKVWCIHDAPARDILWIDAGSVVLQALDEVFASIAAMGYFVVTNGQLLRLEASEQALRACGMSLATVADRPTLAGNLMGLRKDRAIAGMVDEALRLALTEENLAATTPQHRHDQALFSLLFYRELKSVLFADRFIYSGWESPRQVPGQKLWLHRRTLRPQDQAFFARQIGMKTGGPYLPSPPRRSLSERMPMIGKLRGMLRPDQTIYDGVRQDGPA
jgi:hypothetical protein